MRCHAITETTERALGLGDSQFDAVFLYLIQYFAVVMYLSMYSSVWDRAAGGK